MALPSTISSILPLILLTLCRVTYATPECQSTCSSLASSLPNNTFTGPQAQVQMWSLFQSQVRPQCRIEPDTAQHVAEIVLQASQRGCHFAVRGGGTSPFRGASNADGGGITIDLRRMNKVELDEIGEGRIVVGGGAVWDEVYAALESFGMSATGTRNSFTGVGGSILGGGISFLSEYYGWACDSVIEFEVVLANGSVVRASEDEQPDLFWALKGGGSNFGIVTRLTLEVYRDPPTWSSFQLFNMSDLAIVFERLEVSTHQMAKHMLQLATTLGWHTPTHQFVISERAVASERPDLAQSVERMAADGTIHHSPILATHVYQRSILEMSQKMGGMNRGGLFNFFGSVTVKNNAETFMSVARVLQEQAQSILDAEQLQLNIVFNPLTRNTLRQMRKRGGNALALTDTDGPLVIININLQWIHESDNARMRVFMRTLIRRFYEVAEQLDSHHPYIFLNHAFDEQSVFSGYGAANLHRLETIRREVDPEGVFQRLQPGPFKLAGAFVEKAEDMTKSEL